MSKNKKKKATKKAPSKAPSKIIAKGKSVKTSKKKLSLSKSPKSAENKNKKLKISTKAAVKPAAVKAEAKKVSLETKTTTGKSSKVKAATPALSPVTEKVGKTKGAKANAASEKNVAPEVKEEVILTNADGKQYCKVHDCDEAAVIDGHCRLHYIMYWKRNKNKTKILDGAKLDKYIEELTQRYPDKYLEMLRKDLSSEKDFNGIIVEMDADDNEDAESEEDDNRFIEEVRGGVPSTTDDDDGGF